MSGSGAHMVPSLKTMPDPQSVQKIMNAIMAVTDKVESLAKANKNDFGRYQYVNIDQFYSATKKVSVKAGLHWHLQERGVEFNDKPNERGKVVVYTTWKFAVHLFATDADGTASWMDYDTVTVDLPHSGPQTTGIARSYAEKVMMRSTFKMVTGEPDADYMAPAQVPAEPDPEELAKRQEEYKSILEEIEKTAKEATTNDEIDELLKKYRTKLTAMSKDGRETWEKARAVVRERRAELEEKEEPEEDSGDGAEASTDDSNDED